MPLKMFPWLNRLWLGGWGRGRRSCDGGNVREVLMFEVGERVAVGSVRNKVFLLYLPKRGVVRAALC